MMKAIYGYTRLYMFNVYISITYKRCGSFVSIESHPTNLNQTTTTLIIPGKLENGTTLSKLLNKLYWVSIIG